MEIFRGDQTQATPEVSKIPETPVGFNLGLAIFRFPGGVHLVAIFKWIFKEKTKSLAKEVIYFHRTGYNLKL